MSEPISYRDGELIGRRFKPGTLFRYSFTTVGEGSEREPYALVVLHDGRSDRVVGASERLYREGKAPACLIIGVSSGTMLPYDDPDLPPDCERGVRYDDYDVFDPAYGDFLIEELIPRVIAESGCPVSRDPDRHLIAGSSSGGVSSFTVAWFHPDCFHRLYISSPSFLAMGKGDEVLPLIRKAETKPFRIVMHYSGDEPNDYFGDLKAADVTAESAFAYAGYDVTVVFHPNQGHGYSYYGPDDTVYEALAEVWRDYGTKPAAPLHQSPRMDDILLPGEGWEPTEAFPEPAEQKSVHGTYRAEHGRILFTPKGGEPVVVAEGFSASPDIALSSDQRRLYVADAARGCVSFYRIRPDGTLDERYPHGMLHIKPDFKIPGAVSICVDEVDRVYAATELGIQCIISFGIVEAILDLPAGRVPRRLRFDGPYLCAETDAGCFRRRLKHGGRRNEPTEFWHADYCG